jgi:hypothetical protein
MNTSDVPDPSKASELAQKIVSLLIDIDSGTRRRAIDAAMMLLGEKVITDHAPEQRRSDGAVGGQADVALGQFFNRGEKLRPSENAQLCAAYHYAVYGGAPFTLDEIRGIAKEAGVVLPDRLDMTFASAQHAGKKLFQSAGRGSMKPTAAAGVAFDERWGVRPGTKSKA